MDKNAVIHDGFFGGEFFFFGRKCFLQTKIV